MQHGPALMDFSPTAETDIKQVTTQMKKLIISVVCSLWPRTGITTVSHAPLHALSSLSVNGTSSDH